MKKCVGLFFGIIMVVVILTGCESEEENKEGLSMIYQIESNGQVISSDFYGFEMTLPEEWHLATLEEIAAFYQTDDVLESYKAGELNSFPLAISTEQAVFTGGHSEEMASFSRKLLSEDPPTATEIIDFAELISPIEYKSFVSQLSPDEKRVIQSTLTAEQLQALPTQQFTPAIKVKVSKPIKGLEEYLRNEKNNVPELVPESQEGMIKFEDVNIDGKAGTSITYTAPILSPTEHPVARKMLAFEIEDQILYISTYAYNTVDQALIDQALASITFDH